MTGPAYYAPHNNNETVGYKAPLPSHAADDNSTTPGAWLAPSCAHGVSTGTASLHAPPNGINAGTPQNTTAHSHADSTYPHDAEQLRIPHTLPAGPAYY